MSKLINRFQSLAPAKIAVIIFGSASVLAGSIASFFGGMAVSIGLSALVGIGCLVYFLFFDASDRTPSAIPVSVDTEEDKPIPADRIDSLTGLANENGLNAWFTEKCAKLAADQKGIIVLSADLVDFEQIERSRGKEISDAVLVEVSKRVASCTGPDGIAARTSGDEFAAVASVVPIKSAEAAAEHAGRLAELIQRPVELPSGVVWIGGSVGAAYGSPLEGKEVLAKARAALIKAKRLGRGHYVVSE